MCWSIIFHFPHTGGGGGGGGGGGDSARFKRGFSPTFCFVERGYIY